MKELTEDEFYDRMRALKRAQIIFVDTGVTSNITEAFMAYQAIFAEREREIFINSEYDQLYPGRAISRRYERLKCEDCGHDLMFRLINDTEVKTQLVCSNPICDTVYNSDKELDWWMSQLKSKPVVERVNIHGVKPPKVIKKGKQKRRITRNGDKSSGRKLP